MSFKQSLILSLHRRKQNIVDKSRTSSGFIWTSKTTQLSILGSGFITHCVFNYSVTWASRFSCC